MDLVVTLLALLAGLLSFWAWRRHQSFKFFEPYNIPGPKPNFFTGNLLEYVRKGAKQCQTDWLEKYGPVVGIYFGTKPLLITSDPELIKSAWIKDFKKFSFRPDFAIPVGGSLGDSLVESLAVLRGQEWKDTRTILSQTFSTGKIRQMPGHVKSAIDVFIEKIVSEKKIDLVKSCKALCLDALLRSTMSLNNEVQHNDKDPVLRGLIYGMDLFFLDFMPVVLTCFPAISPVAKLYWGLRDKIRNFLNLPSGEAVEILAEKVLEERKKSTASPRKDMIQLMIDSQKLSATEKGTSKTLTDVEIIGNIVDFMFGGLDSMGMALSMSLYHLALNQTLQDECRKEAVEVLGTNETDYDNIIKLKLSENAIKEGLRMYPSGNLAVSRESEESYKYKNCVIPKGLGILAAAIKIHYDPKVWENPTCYNPHRFSTPDSESDSTKFMAFGLGPRGCIANRFALIVLKQILSDVLKNVQFKALPETIMNPEVEYGLFSPKVHNKLIVACNRIGK